MDTDKFTLVEDDTLIPIANFEMGSHNISIGPGAGFDLTLQSYMLCIAAGYESDEYRTQMTPEEFEVINKVVRRALANPVKRSISWKYKHA